MKQYSFLKGLRKGLQHAAIFGVSAVLVFLAFSHQAILDTPLWVLLEQYLKPLLSTVTVGGVLVIIQNWLKNRTPE